MPFFLFVKKLCFGVGACSHSRCVWLLTYSYGIIFRVFFLSFMSCWPSRLDCSLQTFRKFIWYPYPRSHAYAYLTALPNPFFPLTCAWLRMAILYTPCPYSRTQLEKCHGKWSLRPENSPESLPCCPSWPHTCQVWMQYHVHRVVGEEGCHMRMRYERWPWRW